MSKYLIRFVILSIIIFQEIIAIKVNVLDVISKNDELELPKHVDFLGMEVIFRANNTDNLPFTSITKMEESVLEKYHLLEILLPLHDIKDYEKSILNTNNNIFDGNWHKVHLHINAKEEIFNIEVDCSKAVQLNLKNKHLPKNTSTTDTEIELQKLTFYGQSMPQVIDCEDLKNITSSNIEPSKVESIIKVDKSECVMSTTEVRGGHVCAGDLIFEDNFEFFNKSKWEHEIRMPLDSDDAEFVSYQDYSENCFVNLSNLNLMPTLLSDVSGFNEGSIRTGELNLGAKCTVLIDEQIECIRKPQNFRILPPVVSAKIRTKKSFSFKYGRIDVRAKLPKGDWIFPQIHLEPLHSDYGTGSYKSGQIRIAYIRANEVLVDKDLTRIDGARLSGGVVLGVGFHIRNRWLKSTLQPKHLSDDYHVYSMIWTNESIALSLDGQMYGMIRGGFQDSELIPYSYLWKKGEYMAPFDKEFYISLGVAAGGISDFPDDAQNGVQRKEKPWKNTSPKGELNFWKNRFIWKQTWNTDEIGLKVDYVKVWAL